MPELNDEERNFSEEMDEWMQEHFLKTFRPLRPYAAYLGLPPTPKPTRWERLRGFWRDVKAAYREHFRF